MNGKRTVLAVFAAWLLSLGFDMFLHAGILAGLYARKGPFLLAPEQAFARIPLGYLAFLLTTGALAWLVKRLGVRGALPGLKYGAAAGAIVWGALALGLFSITTAPADLLVGWWIGQAIELGLAGAVLGAAEQGASLKRIWLVVGVVVVTLFVATVVLQSTGLAPPMRVAR